MLPVELCNRGLNRPISSNEQDTQVSAIVGGDRRLLCFDKALETLLLLSGDFVLFTTTTFCVDCCSVLQMSDGALIAAEN